MNHLGDVALGLVIGLALGLTGGGGSIITLPVLVYLVGEAVHPAITTSLAIVGAVAAQGSIMQRAIVRWKMGAILGACGVLGAVPGSLLSRAVPGNVLLLLFAAATRYLWEMLVAPISSQAKASPRKIWQRCCAIRFTTSCSNSMTASRSIQRTAPGRCTGVGLFTGASASGILPFHVK